MADAKHPTVHKELREAVTFSGPMDSVYRAAKPSVTLDTGAGGCCWWCWGLGVGMVVLEVVCALWGWVWMGGA